MQPPQSYVIAFEACSGQSANEETIVFGTQSYAEVKDALYQIILDIREKERLPVVNFAAGGIATPSDAALMMQLGVDGVFVGSGIFKSGNPSQRAKAIVEAVMNYDKPEIIAKVSEGLGEAMVGIEMDKLEKKFAGR